MDQNLWFALGGLLGSGLKTWVTTEQRFGSKQSVVEILLGGVIGLLYNIYPLYEFPATATTVQKIALMGFFTYTSSDLLTNLAKRFNIKGVA